MASLPGPDWLREQIAKGLTQQQIADAWEAESGHRVSRSTIAMAIQMMLKRDPKGPRG